MQHKFFYTLVSVLLVLSALAQPVRAADVPQNAKFLDRIVAVVNKDVILQSELDARLDRIKQQLASQQTRLPPDNILKKQVLQRLVMRKLQMQMADRAGLHVSDDMLNQALSNIAARNGFTLAEFPDKLREQGIDYADYREQLRTQMTTEYLQQLDVYRRLKVSDEEIDQYLASEDADNGTQYHLRHILIALPSEPTPKNIETKRARAEQIMGILKGKTSFAETAVAYSDGQQALDGGDLGWRTLAQLPTLFTDVVSKMQPGEVSQIIRSPSGFHIIKLEDVRRKNQKKVIVKQTHARHILIKPNAVLSDQDAQAKLKKLRAKIENGADFAKVAKQESDDAPSAADGGDLGWTNPGDLDPEFEKVMDNLKPGEVSQPFKTRFGWHIVQVMGRRDKDMTEAARRKKAADAIRQRKFEEQLPIWMQGLWDKAYLEFYVDDANDIRPDAPAASPNAR